MRHYIITASPWEQPFRSVSIQFDKRQRPRVTINFHERTSRRHIHSHGEGKRSPFTLSQGRLTPRLGGFDPVLVSCGPSVLAPAVRSVLHYREGKRG